MKVSIRKLVCVCFLTIFITMSAHSLCFAQKVNVNTAPAAELVTLTGVGEKTAGKIIERRLKYGDFKSLDDLLKVKGIGEKTLEKISGQVVFVDNSENK